MEVLTLIDNLVYGEILKAEHGLSFLIKWHGKKILFDTGQSGAIVHNAGYLFEDLTDVDYVILSHGHYDHCGGLEEFLAINETATIYIKPKALDEKYAVHELHPKQIGFNLKKPLRSYPNHFVFLDDDLEIMPGLKIIAKIHTYSSDLVDTERFLTKSDMALIQDPFADELFLLLTEGKKNILVTGCSHKGILNILKTAFEKNNHQNIHYVFGGMHFGGELLRHLDQHLMQFSKFGIEKLYVNHCTGVDGYMRLKLKFPSKVAYAFTGFHVDI